MANKSFIDSPLGHLIVSALVTAALAFATTIANSPDAATVLGGGAAVTIAKFIVDWLRQTTPSL